MDPGTSTGTGNRYLGTLGSLNVWCLCEVFIFVVVGYQHCFFARYATCLPPPTATLHVARRLHPLEQQEASDIYKLRRRVSLPKPAVPHTPATILYPFTRPPRPPRPHHDGWVAAAEGGPPRFQPHCPPGYPLAAEGALEGPALQYHHHLLPAAVGASRPAPAPAEGEGEGRLLAHGPRQQRFHSAGDDQCQQIGHNSTGSARQLTYTFDGGRSSIGSQSQRGEDVGRELHDG